MIIFVSLQGSDELSSVGRDEGGPTPSVHVITLPRTPASVTKPPDYESLVAAPPSYEDAIKLRPSLSVVDETCHEAPGSSCPQYEELAKNDSSASTAAN